MLKKNVFITFGGNLISTMFLVGASVVLARILGPADRGILGLALLVPIISATFCTFGQETVNNTFAGLYQNQRVCLFQQTLIVTLAGSVVSSVLILGFFFRLPFDKGQFALIDPEIVWLSLLVAPLLMLNTMILGLLRGIGRINTAAMVQVIGSASYLLL
ncbi:MAG: hypothetical protein GY869_31920, partial [Planctomycetes bacterium]|nr:hypothetical protein [Planctomycetota bacterium]